MESTASARLSLLRGGRSGHGGGGVGQYLERLGKIMFKLLNNEP